eukprot:superscaffoldBa00000223_g2893
MHNTSSFFKVSLKTNNKALAVALEAQKERSRQLEMEIVYLQKQVEALCFELATKKYKHRKLLPILKNLHSNTLLHLDMVADLFSDSDLPKLSDNYKSDDINSDNPPIRSLPDELPPQPEMSRELLLPPQKITADVPEKNMSANVFSDTVDEKRHSSKYIQARQTGTSRQSSSLRDEVERLSMIFSQPGFDVKSVNCLKNSQTASVVSTSEKSKPSLSNDIDLPSSSVKETGPDHVNRQENTVLMNTTMEMTTVSNAIEIVTVETKAKKTGHSGKPKSKKKKEQENGSTVAENPQVRNSTDSRLSEVQSAPTEILLQTDEHALKDFAEPEVIESQLLKTQCSSGITSRIPKLSKFGACNPQKMSKDIFKDHDSTMSKTESCDIVLPDLDDYFMDPENHFSKAKESVKLPPEKNIAGEARSKIKCRRSKTKHKRMSFVTRKTFVTLPSSSQESENSQSKLELVHNKVEEEVKEKYESPKHQEPPEEFLFCADEVTHPETEHESPPPSISNKLQSKIVMATNSGGSHKSRCRETFVISVAKDSTSYNRASPEIVPIEQDFVSHTESNCEVEEPSSVMDASFERQHSEPNLHRHRGRAFVEEKQSSCKRPWVATQDSGSFQEDLSSNENHDEVLPLDQVSTAVAYSHKVDTSDEAVHQNLGDLLTDEMPPWLATDDSTADTEVGSLLYSPKRKTSGWMRVIEESATITTEASPVGRVLTSLTNTITTPDMENRGRTRRRNGVVSYKEPTLNRGDYIGQKLRENSFDPKGKGTSTVLDDLAHYDLAISVALWWLDREQGRDAFDRDIIGTTSVSGSAQYPNRLEREAMILSSFAGMIMDSLPVEEILALYRCKPAASYPNQESKGSIVYPFTLSYHPFAMLGSYKAVHHSKRHNQKLKRWLSERAKTSAPTRGVSVQSSSSSSSSHSFLSDSTECHEDKAEHYEGSQESLQG